MIFPACPSICSNNFTGLIIGNEIMNYPAGVILILAYPLSFIFNPIVAIYHYRQSRISATLFTILSITGFIYNLFRPLYSAFNFLKPYRDNYGPATVLQAISSVMNTTLFWFSALVVSLLAVTRYISIKYPFYQLKRRYLYGYLSFFAIIQFVLQTMRMTVLLPKSMLESSDDVYVNYAPFIQATTVKLKNKTYNTMLGYILPIWLVVQYIFSSILSILSVKEIKKVHHKMSNNEKRNPPSQVSNSRSKQKGIKTIAIMNIMNFISIFIGSCSLLLSFAPSNKTIASLKPQVLVYNVLILPVLITSTNPLIIAFYSSGVRAMLQSWNEKSKIFRTLRFAMIIGTMSK